MEEYIRVLTRREIEVLELIADGCKSEEIARKLCISRRTVNNHRQNIYEKLDITTVAELTKFAIRKGIIDL